MDDERRNPGRMEQGRFYLPQDLLVQKPNNVELCNCVIV